MKLSEYFNFVEETSTFPVTQENLYPFIALRGEVGEVLNVWKKVLRKGGEITEEVRQTMKDELGDVLWYYAACSFVCRADTEKAESQEVSAIQAFYADDVKDLKKQYSKVEPRFPVTALERPEKHREISYTLCSLFDYASMFPKKVDLFMVCYCTALSYFNLTLEEVAQFNMDKLNKRRNA